ncbi:class I tRNA ligase family protein, partial [Salmonella enterica subsp. enterica serovar Weltevreden]|uniref:class I tRNA ligase family protein n=1 Tax=Salmonella enterica TaxID=28901 RepID=UPI001F32C3C8
FMSYLMISEAMKGKSPYRQVLTHVYTFDGQGRKMSKSIGNTVSPQDVMNKLGADILRLWVAYTDYTVEMAVSDEI